VCNLYSMTRNVDAIRQLAACVCGSNPAGGVGYLASLKGQDLVEASEECKKYGVVAP